VVLEDPAAFGQTLAGFCAQGRQRTLGTLVARLRERSRREFGIDVLEPGALGVLGFAPQSSVTVLLPTAGTPILVLAAPPGEGFEPGLARALGGKYARTAVRDVTVGGHALRALTVGDVVTPRVYWATAAGRTYLTGGRSKDALAQLLTSLQQGTLGALPQVRQAAQLLGPHPLVWAHRGPPAAGGTWQLGGLTVRGDGLQSQLALADAAGATPLCQNSGAEASRTATLLASALAPGALVLGSAPSTQALLALSPQSTDEAQLTAVAGAAVSQRLHRLLTAAPAVQEALEGLDAPWAAAILPHPAAAGGAPSLGRLVNVAFVAQAISDPDRQRLAALAKRLARTAAQGGPGAQGMTLGAKPVALGGKRALPVHMPAPAPGFDGVVVDHTLIVTSGPDGLPRALKALGQQAKGAALPPDAMPTGADRHADVRVQFDGLAQLGEAAILAGAKGPLAQTPLGAMPELLLLGPTGDLLREVGALGRLEAHLGCRPEGLLVNASITLAAP
jgi:hypothetical protein